MSAGAAPGRTRSWWGWGWEGAAVAGSELTGLAETVAGLTGASITMHDPPAPRDLGLTPPRCAPPASLAGICSSADRDRASHAHGKAFRDIARNLLGQLDHPPDMVARPRDEAEVIALLEWCVESRLAAIPYGGGSSVVGGIEADVGPEYRGAVSIDLCRMASVVDVDLESGAVLVEGGALGPDLEAGLRPLGLTLRHFPQSFEFSTVGGWLATRAGGHYATLQTHIDDLTESIRAITPTGLFESRRLPGSGAGPSPDRLFLGSEGTLGVITQAWLRVVRRPVWRASASVRFDTFGAGIAAARGIAQARLYPANCRLLDGPEAALSAGTAGSGGVLVLGFESADHPVESGLDRALEICRDHGGAAGIPRTGNGSAVGDQDIDAADRWRSSFLRAPYLRDAMVRMGMVVETFETACTWDRLEALHAGVVATATEAAGRVCGSALVTCRLTHLYPDGAAPYFTLIAPGRWGDQVRQWDEIKAAVSGAIVDAGGTITHHHAVGRVHRQWAEAQRPEPFERVLRAAKRELDPAGILNPGALVTG